MADYRDLAAALGGGYGQDTGGITPDTLITLNNGKKATAGDLLGMLKDFGGATLSNLESLVRGGVAQVPGAGGDLEGLARMGINKAFGAGGVNVSPTPVLPTTTDILSMIPRATAPRQETAGMEELGGFMTPATAKLAGKTIKATEGLPVGMSIRSVTAPQDTALALAQQRAALPVEQGGLGLPANNTAEMRAQAMGFDVPAYRGYQFGTGRNKNTFYTDNPEIASQYAVKSGGAQYEINAGGDRYLFDTLEEAKRAQKSSVGGKIKKLKNSPTVEANLLRMENPLVVNAKDQNWNFIENPFAPAENLQTLEKQLASVTSDKVVNGRPYTIDQQKQDIVRANYFNVYTDTNRLAEEARKRGYSDTVIQNVYDTALPIEGDKSNYLSNVYVSSNPENVRSRFAAFDPFRKDVATATAMGVALPDLLAAEKEDKQKKLSKALAK
jgi:hypothetical protein